MALSGQTKRLRVCPLSGVQRTSPIGVPCRLLTQCMVRPCVAREFRRVGGSGLASMYPAFDWSVLLLAIMGISAGAISLAERPDRAIWVTSVRTRREDRTSISSCSLADLGRQLRGLTVTQPEACSPRSPGRGPVRSRRCERACWRARSPARCGAAASWLPRSSA